MGNEQTEADWREQILGELQAIHSEASQTRRELVRTNRSSGPRRRWRGLGGVVFWSNFWALVLAPIAVAAFLALLSMLGAFAALTAAFSQSGTTP